MKQRIPDKSVLILLIVITFYAVLCLTKLHYVRLTADSMLYFSLAEKYLSGDFQNAINGYWGPLLAWVILPFMYFGAGDVFTINALNAIFGIATIIGIWILSDRFELTEKMKCIILICLLPILLKFSIVQPMDFLLVCLLIYYLGIVFDNNYHMKVRSGIFSGMLGAFAYLTKAYAFPFFIVHFIIINILHFFKHVTSAGRRKVFNNTIAGFLIFLLMSGAWIMVISDKYGYYTFSTMRETNFNAPGPEVVGGGLEFGVPVFTEGFFAPPNETAFVVWEDPSYLRGEPWSAWKSMAHFKHFIKLTIKNIIEGWKIFEAFSTLAVAIITAYILLLSIKRRKEILSAGVLLYPLFTLILFSGGYVLFHFEERYVWLSNMLLLLMGAHVISVLFKTGFFESDLRKNILIVVFIISFIAHPAKFYMQTANGSIDRDMHDLSMELKPYNIEGNIASNREPASHAAWHNTFRLAYWLKSRYFGQARENISEDDLKTELEAFDIDYYFFWGMPDDSSRFLLQYKDVTNGAISDLQIFSLKDQMK